MFRYYKNFLSGGFRSKVKIVTPELFATPTYFCWQLAFYRHLPTSGRQNRVKNLLYPPFIYIFLNPECVRIPWVLAPKNFPIANFRVRSDLQKISLFHEFSCPLGKKYRRPAADSIFDATDLPHSSFEPLYPKLFRGTPRS